MLKARHWLAAITVFTTATAFASTPDVVQIPASLRGVMLPLVDAISGSLGRKLAALPGAESTQKGVLLLADRERIDGQHVPAGLAASGPMVLVARPSLVFFDGAEFVAAARRGSRLRIAHDGPGSVSEQCAKLLAEQLDATLVLVAAPPAQALTDDRADLACLEAPSAVPLAKSGTATAYAIAAEDRLAALWDVSTGPELGIPLFTLTTWYALYVTTAQDAAKAHAGLQAFLASDANVQALAELGLAPFPVTHRSIDAHQTFVAATR